MDWFSTIIRTFFDFGAMAEVLPQLLGSRAPATP